jgi:hypothetical protein
LIIEGIIDVIWTAISFIVGLLPTLDISLPTGFFSWLIDIYDMVAYFVPLVDFMLMLGIWFVVVNFQIIWKTIQRIWDAIPFV